MEQIPQIKPWLGKEELKELKEVLKSQWISGGPKIKEFQEKIAKVCGVKHAITVCNGTQALYVGLKILGVGPGDEVIVPDFTFIASANAVVWAGAKPVFVDVDAKTFNIDPKKIEKALTKKTRAIMPVHLYGQMVDMKRIRQIADRHHLLIIEDAAHAIEAQRDGVKPGQLGDAACFSFYATKNITSGEGGAVATNSEAIAEKLRLLRNHGMGKNAAERYTKRYEHWDMELLGWKYNMSNIQAAMLLNQLENIENYWQRREQICQAYEEAFSDTPQLRCMKVLPDSKSARHLFTVLVPPDKRDRLLGQLQESGVGIAVNYRAIHLLKFYRETFGYKEGMFPIAESIGHSTLTLPLYPRLRDEEVSYVIDTVKANLEAL